MSNNKEASIIVVKKFQAHKPLVLESSITKDTVEEAILNCKNLNEMADLEKYIYPE